VDDKATQQLKKNIYLLEEQIELLNSYLAKQSSKNDRLIIIKEEV
jgi:hypothetical protein